MKKIGDIARAILPKWEPCESCKPDGWVQYGKVVKRCRCWEIHQERLQDLMRTAKDRA